MVEIVIYFLIIQSVLAITLHDFHETEITKFPIGLWESFYAWPFALLVGLSSKSLLYKFIIYGIWLAALAIFAYLSRSAINPFLSFFLGIIFTICLLAANLFAILNEARYWKWSDALSCIIHPQDSDAGKKKRGEKDA
jgi:hypothetical protein